MITSAMILAAGYGTRLKPLTVDTPKAMITYNGKPMIENVIAKLIDKGINEITINTHYFADKIKDYLNSKLLVQK
jgi:NDP-sugar pyrophosphorylase family protein